MRKIAVLVMSALLSLLTGCASVSTSHSFQFDMLDNKQVKLMNWAYSSQRAPADFVKRAESGGKGLAGAGVVGLKPVGEFLYVKWQVPPSSESHEVRIDLRPLLPWNMNGAELRPSFNERNELEVYLATPSEEAPSFFMYRGRGYSKTALSQIYPASRKVDAVAVELKK